MQKRIAVQLTTESITHAIAEIKAYKQEIISRTNELMQALVDEGVMTVKTWIIAYDAVETGSLLNSIEGIFDATTGRGFIKANSDHAAFVEFGTGVMGQTHAASSPDKPEGWLYDVNKHEHDGWYYYDHGVKRWTKGREPRPFMWQAFNELCSKAHDIARMKYNG